MISYIDHHSDVVAFVDTAPNCIGVDPFVCMLEAVDSIVLTRTPFALIVLNIVGIVDDSSVRIFKYPGLLIAQLIGVDHQKLRDP